MYKELKERVWRANMDLPKYGLITFTWGNASGIDRDRGLVAIKPSGVSYDELRASDIVVLDLEGNKIEGELKPSSDTATHLELYKNFEDIGGIVHTHSPWATSFAQAGRGIIPLGTTHGDYFYGEIPCTRKMTREEIEGDYERETGKVIVETLKGLGDMDALYMPAVLVNMHAPFTWGKDPEGAVEASVVLEEVAKMAHRTFSLNPSIGPMDKVLLDKHFLRKHGKNAYYGQ